MYRALCAAQLASFFSWHKSMLKLNHVLASILKELAADGFCRPAESDGKNGAEDAADGKTTEGTGMAEGTGAKNVSNEIEDESQLEGLQSDVPQEKRDDEEEPQDGDDDAVEMNMDFEGDLEDRGDGEKDSGDEEDDDEEPEGEEGGGGGEGTMTRSRIRRSRRSRSPTSTLSTPPRSTRRCGATTSRRRRTRTARPTR